LADRIIIRRYSPQVTTGGGFVVDPAPDKHRAYSPGRADSETLAAWLRDLAWGAIDRKIYLWIEAGRERGMGVAELGSRAGFSNEQIEAIVSGLVAQNLVMEIAARSPIYVAPAVITRLKQRMVETLVTYHQESPLSEGISREELRRRLLTVLADESSVALFNYLCSLPEFVVDRDVVRLRAHSVQLNQHEAGLESQILKALQQEGLQPSLPEDLLARLQIDLPLGKRLLALLLKRGETLRIGEYYYARVVIDSLVERLREQKGKEPTIDVSRFKELTGLSRKYAIPLLEHLDRIRVTRRLGDIRQVL
jgi:selenocysteine-specific elongation factor